jgi:hypothetical protein
MFLIWKVEAALLYDKLGRILTSLHLNRVSRGKLSRKENFNKLIKGNGGEGARPFPGKCF